MKYLINIMYKMFNVKIIFDITDWELCSHI